MEDENIKNQTNKQFECAQCKLLFKYNKYRKLTDVTTNLHFLEEVYYIINPFEGPASMPLVLGSACSICKSTVCVSSSCSVFYTKRFCRSCVAKCPDCFPNEIIKDLKIKL